MIDKSQADELKRRIQALCDNSVSYRPKYYQAACDYIDSLTQQPAELTVLEKLAAMMPVLTRYVHISEQQALAICDAVIAAHKEKQGMV